jgi:acetyl-CoA carboxylase biotin carboxyl carrier protein
MSADDETPAGAAASTEAPGLADATEVASAGADGADGGDGSAPGAVPDAVAPPADLDPGDAALLGLIDRLGALLDRSELSELAVESGGTRVVLRKPAALAAVAVAPSGGSSGEPVPAATPSTTPAAESPGGAAAEALARPSVKAPLTGVWYSSPAPGSAPFVAVGRELAVGQVIGLIEAMKLFNEIKSDLAGRVVRVIPESGALVKAKQPLIEVEPL